MYRQTCCKSGWSLHTRKASPPLCGIMATEISLQQQILQVHCELLACVVLCLALFAVWVMHFAFTSRNSRSSFRYLEFVPCRVRDIERHNIVLHTSHFTHHSLHIALHTLYFTHRTSHLALVSHSSLTSHERLALHDIRTLVSYIASLPRTAHWCLALWTVARQTQSTILECKVLERET